MIKKFNKAIAALSVVGLTLSKKITCMAGELAEELAGDPFDVSFLEQVPEDGGFFAEITTFVREFAASAYGLVAIVAVVLCVFFLIGAGISLMRGGRHKDEAMDKLVGVFLGGALIFGAVTIVSTFAGMVRGL